LVVFGAGETVRLTMTADDFRRIALALDGRPAKAGRY
jgi:hypothetical protein